MNFSAFLSLVRDRKAITRTLSLRDGPAPPADGESDQGIDRPQGLDQIVHPDRIRWRVERIVEETPTVSTLELRPIDGQIPAFLPGQYVNVFIEIDGVQTSRPQSISSLPGQDFLTVTVRSKDHGYVSPHLVDVVRPGDELLTSGPEGETVYFGPRDGERLVLLAGGTGIAPLAPMAEYLLDRHEALTITLICGARSDDELLFGERLKRLERRYPERFVLRLVLSEASPDWRGIRGLLDRAVLAEHLDAEDSGRAAFFVCGPRAMQQFVRGELAAMGVPPRRVHTEVVGAADDPSQFSDWPEDLPLDRRVSLDVEGRGLSTEVAAGEPLLNSLERAGIEVPALCRSGVCGSCRTRLVTGKVITDPLVAMRPGDREAGFILPCVCYPLEDVKLSRR